MSKKRIVEAMAIDINHLVPNQFKVSHITKLLNIPRTSGSALMNMMMELSLIKTLGRGLYEKLDMRDFPVPSTRKTLFALRARYGWFSMPQEDYWERIHLLMPSVITIKAIQQITKFVHEPSARSFIQYVARRGYVVETGKHTWEKNMELTAAIDLPSEWHETGFGYPHLTSDGLIIIKIDRTAEEIAQQKWDSRQNMQFHMEMPRLVKLLEIQEEEKAITELQVESLKEQIRDRDDLIAQFLSGMQSIGAIAPPPPTA